MSRLKPAVFITLILLIGSALGGCTTISYYMQSIAGQSELTLKKRPIKDLLGDEQLAQEERERLETVLALRRFSTVELGLPENDSYLSYADLERRYVVWNIFAAEEFSLTPKRWCYLFVGCLSYRGYFSEQDARQKQQQLQQQGYDVFLGGVTAYSTLGWFNDPVLNTMLRWSDIYLAKVMFHELAHQQLYVRDDTEFNESYAEAVAIIGVNKWLQQQGNQQAIESFYEEQKREKEFQQLVLRYNKKLAALYDSEVETESKRQKKQQLFQAMRDEYQLLKQRWNDSSYDNWFAIDLNNAKLASVTTYKIYVDDFLAIYEKIDKNLALFYDIIQQLSRCGSGTRREMLKQRLISYKCE